MSNSGAAELEQSSGFREPPPIVNRFHAGLLRFEQTFHSLQVGAVPGHLSGAAIERLPTLLSNLLTTNFRVAAYQGTFIFASLTVEASPEAGLTAWV